MNKFKRIDVVVSFGLLSLLIFQFSCSGLADERTLEERFLNPPAEDRVAFTWFWSNAIDKAAITRDLEEMSRVGAGRAIPAMTLAHSATKHEGGVVFLSPEYLELFRFALDEAERLGIKISCMPSNGWYQGGPWVSPEMGAQMLVWSETEVNGPGSFSAKLTLPDKHRPGRFARIARGAMDYFNPVATLAFRKDEEGRLILSSLVDLRTAMSVPGFLNWDIPTGEWVIYHFGHVPNMVRMKQDSPGYGGLQIDHLSRRMMERHLEEIAVPMLEAAGPHVGVTLDFLHENSMELGHYDWTPELPVHFMAHNGYDIVPLLPVLTGASFSGAIDVTRIINDFEEFLHTLLVEEHFVPFKKFAYEHGIMLHAQTGETGSGITVKGVGDLPEDEFWMHRGMESDHPVVFNRNNIFASHVYGQNRNLFEAFTSHQHWLETPGQMKALANEVYAMGLTNLNIHGFSSSPLETPPPGDVYFAGTHFNPGATWWDSYAKPLTSFFNRSQTMLTAGLPVTDMLYLDGPALQEMILSNEMKHEKDRRFWKFDGIPAGRLVEAVSVNRGGRLVLPNGQTYKVLVVADTEVSLEAMQAVERLVERGATVWFQAVPQGSPFYSDGPEADDQIKQIVERLGGDLSGGLYSYGKGKVLTGAYRDDIKVIGTASYSRRFFPGMHAEAMDRLGISPAFEYKPDDVSGRLFFFHREFNGIDIYFIANAMRGDLKTECLFRVEGREPELWDPVKGTIEPVSLFEQKGGRTSIPLEFAAHESFFLVFRKKASLPPSHPSSSIAAGSVNVSGPWIIEFKTAREDEENFVVESDTLFYWHDSYRESIATFSGTANYHTEIELPMNWQEEGARVILDIGASPGHYELKGTGAGQFEITENVYDALCAEIFINGNSAGVLWCSPYRMNITGFLKPGNNRISIAVTNTLHNWRIANQFYAGAGSVLSYQPSRGPHPWELIGLSLPPSPSGLPGPVKLILKK